MHNSPRGIGDHLHPWLAPGHLRQRRLSLQGYETVASSIEPTEDWEIRPLLDANHLPGSEGGLGVAGVLADPLRIHTIRGGAGIGQANGPVARADYTWNGWILSLGGAAWHTEQAYETSAWANATTNGTTPSGVANFAWDAALLMAIRAPSLPAWVTKTLPETMKYPAPTPDYDRKPTSAT